MQLVDTHSHLYASAFRNDIAQVMERAESEGVTKIYLPAIDSTEHAVLLDLEKQYPGKCEAMMGLHPCYVKENYRDELELVKKWLEARPFKAVGEIGLDYYWDRTFTAQQQEAFRIQVQWSIDYRLPIVIHSRNSVEDCIRILQEFPKGSTRGIFHCFSDSLDIARQIMDLGFYMGIGGVITYKKSGLDAVVAGLPLESLVLETDAPYLPPVPFRGKRNESSYIKYVAAKVAEVKQVDLETVAAITTANAQKIFGS